VVNFKPAIISLAAAATFASAVLPASAQDFYKGKTISIIVGFSPGGLYDLTARVIARHLGDHIPGKPLVIVQTMTGAGGTFSAGMDLKAFMRGESPTFAGRGLCGITQTPPRKPLVGAAEGWALAGGFELLLACESDARGRTGLEQQPYPQAAYLMQALNAAAAVNLAASERQGLSGAAIGEEIRRRRLSAISAAKKRTDTAG